MADGISADFEDVYRLTAQLERVDGEIPKGVRGAMRGAAYTAKEAWQDALESSDVPAAASTIWYDLAGNAASASATVSNSRGSARLQGYAHAREFGSMTVAPAAPAAAAAQVAAEDLAKGLAIAGERAIKRALGAS